jgi:Terminase large subunit, T4likevirus-type, N-terminal/Terminase RNaseH-like domain
MAKNTANFEKLKQPNQPTTYTQAQLDEIISCAKDPVWFMERFLFIQHPLHGKIQFEAYEFQKHLIKTYWQNRNTIAMIPRQSGKTTTAAGYLLWYAMFNPDVTVLIAANKFKAANEIMMRIKYAYEELPNHIRPGVTEYNVTSIKFDNGSRIVATTTTPDSGRGMSISLLYLDEFAYVRPRVAVEFWTAMAPTLATGGKCIITSTPASDEDMFAELWFGATNTIDDNGIEIPNGLGANGFKSFSAHYSDVPGRDEKWAEAERAKIGDDRFQREYECKFAGEESTLISSLCLQRLRGQDPLFKTNDVRWYDKVLPERTYLVSLDPSAGVGKDPACIEVWSLPDMVQIAEWSSNRVSIPNQVRTMQTIINHIYNDIKRQGYKGEPEIYFTLENNTWGEAALQSINDIGEENFMAQLLNEPRKYGTIRFRKGLNTNGRSKANACAKLKSLLESNKLKVNSKMLVRQLKFFVAKGDSFAAKQGEHDDCVMSTILCVRMMQMVTNWDDKVGELMRDVFDAEEGNHRDPLPFSIMIS